MQTSSTSVFPRNTFCVVYFFFFNHALVNASFPIPVPAKSLYSAPTQAILYVLPFIKEIFWNNCREFLIMLLALQPSASQAR